MSHHSALIPLTHACPHHTHIPLKTASPPSVIANNVARRTATSEDRESLIRQRCGDQESSSLAKVCSAPVSRDRIEDVNNIGTKRTCSCTKQVIAARSSHHHSSNECMPNPLLHIPLTPQAPCNHRKNSNATYRHHQRRSRVLDSAAMWQ
jgi:hypothetical protein